MDLMALLSINSTVCIDFWYWVTCSKCSAGGILACIVDKGDVVLPEVGGSDDVALEQVHPVNLLSRRSARNLSVKMCSNEAAVPGSKNSRGGRVHSIKKSHIHVPESAHKVPDGEEVSLVPVEAIITHLSPLLGSQLA